MARIQSKIMVLLIGGAGYVGAHINKVLYQNKYETVVLDNLIHGHSESVKWGTFIEGSFEDEKLILEIFEKYSIDLVIFQAEYRLIRPERSERYYTHQIFTLVNLLDLLMENKNFKNKNFIFHSSNEVYGIPEKCPVSEEHKLEPIHPKGDSKRIIENIFEDYQNLYDLNFVIFRYFDIAGADYEEGIGEAHIPETHLVPSLLDVALGYQNDFTIFGNNYDTPDKTCIRDFVHVSDIAQAHILAYEKILKREGSEVFNLCSGVGHSVLEIIHEVQKITNSTIKIITGKRRRGDVPSMIGDPTKAEKMLGWKRQKSDLNQIIHTAWQWQKMMREI